MYLNNTISVSYVYHVSKLLNKGPLEHKEAALQVPEFPLGR